MAFYRGEEGSVKFKSDTADDYAAIASTTGWSLSVTKDVLDCTAHGATSRSYVGSFVGATGSAELLYTATAGETTDFIKDISTTSDTGDAKFQLYLSTTGNKKIEFNGIVTSADFGTTVGDLQSVSIGFQMTGDITAFDV
tara:strand:- start:86 stop:505 length:420 start_codon:yes stop_codon:yes gene_type:complete